MGKAVGYIIALVVIVIVIYLVATHSSKPKTGPAAAGAGAAPGMTAITYAVLKDQAVKQRQREEESVKNLPEGVRPPPPTSSIMRVNGLVMTDKGTVVGVDSSSGHASVSIDVDGDGQPDVNVGFGGAPVPEGVTQSATVDFTARVTAENMEPGTDKLVITATAPPQNVKVAGGSRAVVDCPGW